MNILLVDDDRDRLESLRDVLSAMQHDVVATSSAEHAILTLFDAPFDAVVTDHDLGTAYGTALLSSVAKFYPATRRMIFTAGDLPRPVNAHVAVEHMDDIDTFVRAVKTLFSP